MNHDPRIDDSTKRYDFLILFDVTDGNPNGDPDAGNLPRLDPETMQGIVTDVCLKRKIRNYVDLRHSSGYDQDDQGNGFGIFVRDSGVALNRKIKAAAEKVNATPDKKKANRDGRKEVCSRYYDVRTFGGVLSVGDYNCGQVRGPMQLTFARSIDPIIPSDVSITRVAITKEGEQKETEMGRKAVVPYGLYLAKGFYSPLLAKDTGFGSEDLKLFWEALSSMFENDRSASRGDMRLLEVFIFAHESELGNAHAGKLFDRVSVARKPGVETARKAADYEIRVQADDLPKGVTLYKLID